MAKHGKVFKCTTVKPQKYNPQWLYCRSPEPVHDFSPTSQPWVVLWSTEASSEQSSPLLTFFKKNPFKCFSRI